MSVEEESDEEGAAALSTVEPEAAPAASAAARPFRTRTIQLTNPRAMQTQSSAELFQDFVSAARSPAGLESPDLTSDDDSFDLSDDDGLALNGGMCAHRRGSDDELLPSDDEPGSGAAIINGGGSFGDDDDDGIILQDDAAAGPSFYNSPILNALRDGVGTSR